MTLPQLFIWAVILVTLGQLYLIARYLLWPRIQRITHCPWCWQDAGIGSEYPRPWSSTICPYHDQRVREQSRAHRLTKQRRAAPATSAVTGRPQKERSLQQRC